MIIQLQKLIYIFMRITAFIVICPGFSFKGLPNIFKIGLSFSISIIIYMIIPAIEVEPNMLYFFILVIKEILLGLAMGYITKLIFAAMEIAGQMVDFQVGFSMASVFDPSMGTTASNYGKAYYWLSICVFFLLDMHHKIINALILSFNYIPVTEVGFTGFHTKSIVNLFSLIFELAFNVAAPIIVVVLIVDILLGVISKTVPQINVLMLGMPIKTMISFFISMIMLSWLMKSFGSIIGLIPEYLEAILSL
ncbi:flagellar biosynthetic protein FliR [Wansuia hejianensis]|uniref:Flagellar biosynthetic protein FliR n=1 Tax=Wansuia hejianensis TaxID=2763667 RepID=A0A926EXR5_9FIRM|nr:flagellar biosynthetic protein FliR [Wansuia hejianensis]MBC8590288.1 flagellar biosynthetic protein FliR [Wansuia hejianensis]